ncbi:MAG: hypothetical protein KJS64_03645 [Acidobacteria bacterium]|nr:hypothetical protein [Acidobacteriota bacterium]
MGIPIRVWSLLRRLYNFDRATTWAECRDALRGKTPGVPRGRRTVGLFVDYSMIALSAVYLAAYSLEVLVFDNARCEGRSMTPLNIMNTVQQWVWAIFVVELAYQVVVFCGAPAGRRRVRAFFADNVISIIAVILPFFRALRIFRVMAMTSSGLYSRHNHRVDRVLWNIAVAVVILSYGGALSALQLEHRFFLETSTCTAALDPHIHHNAVLTFTEALQWSLHALSIGSSYTIYSPDGKWLELLMNIAGFILFGSIVGVMGDLLSRHVMETLDDDSPH